MNAARQHTDGEHHSGDTTVLLAPIVVPPLCAQDVITTFLSLRTGLWCNQYAVRAAALSHGIGLDDFVAASARMLADGRIVERDGCWMEGNA